MKKGEEKEWRRERELEEPLPRELLKNNTRNYLFWCIFEAKVMTGATDNIVCFLATHFRLAVHPEKTPKRLVILLLLVFIGFTN